ncbi:MAG: hypothetical protein WCQ95_04235 [Bacteroidota bacterium]
MNRFIQFCILWAMSLLIISCSCNQSKKDEKIDSPKIDTTVRIKIKRYEKALFNLNKKDLQNELKRIKPEYGFFLDGDLDDKANMKQLSSYVNDPQMIENYNEVQKKFPNLTQLERELSSALSYFKFYFPNRKIPQVYTYVCGMDFENPIIYADSVLMIALDMYLGGKYKLYTSFGLPNFIKNNMSGEYITRDCINAMANYYCYTDMKNSSCLDNMVYNGKIQYFIDAMLPELNDTIKIKYTKKQLTWCYDNEARMWAFFIDNKLLYSKESNSFNKFFDPGPFTTSFSKTSPPRTGTWVGWRIVRALMRQNNEMNLKQLIEVKDAQKILKLSKYKPAKV